MPQQKRTFCRVCEPACGLIATVEDEQLIKLEPDKDHPISKGYVCNKGIYGADVHNDPDRPRTPLRRKPDGDLEAISWDTALAEISARLQAIIDEHGTKALAAYTGNPNAFNTLFGPSFGSFATQLGVRKFFSSGTQDCANKFAGSQAVFGTRTLHPLPDIEHADFIMILGENPAVSHMSFMSIPNPMQHLRDAEARGAEIVYINPRIIESANTAGRVVQIKPDADVYLLAAMLAVIDQELGFDPAAAEHGENLAALQAFVAEYPPEKVSHATGLSAEEIRALALAFAQADKAAVHMSTGVNMGRQGTLAYWLMHMLSLVTGNLGRTGGNYHSLGFYERSTSAGAHLPEEQMDTPWGEIRQPGGVGINLPGNLMANYLSNPDDPVKALLVSGGNPVLSIGGEEPMRKALEALDLIICVDIYRNATSEYADYILPAAGAFEREDINMTGLGLQFQPSLQFTEAVVPPQYERQPDWWIYEKLCQAMGFKSAFDDVAEGELPDMWGRVNGMLKSQGRTMAELREAGIIALERSQPEAIFDRMHSEHQRVDCFPASFDAARVRMANILKELDAEPESQLKLISKRDGYMMNSWYANVAKLKSPRRRENYLYMHPTDAEARQLSDGDQVRIHNQYGTIAAPLKLSDDLRPGVVAMTHGWGQAKSKGMQTAAEFPGSNCNVLLPSGPGSFEPLPNQSHMTGIAVEVGRHT